MRSRDCVRQRGRGRGGEIEGEIGRERESERERGRGKSRSWQWWRSASGALSIGQLPFLRRADRGTSLIKDNPLLGPYSRTYEVCEGGEAHEAPECWEVDHLPNHDVSG